MKIKVRKSAIKDLKSINEPFKNKIHNKISELRNFTHYTSSSILSEVEFIL